jgi:hypothetical protein
MSHMRSNFAWSRQPNSGAGWFPPPCASEFFALHEAANFKRSHLSERTFMKLFTFETADIIHVVDPGLLGGLPR